MKGTWKPHILLNFKMTSQVGSELLRDAFSLDLKASICCCLPHLKLVPPLMHRLLIHQLVPKAGDGPAWGWYLVHLLQVTKGKVLL